MYVMYSHSTHNVNQKLLPSVQLE